MTTQPKTNDSWIHKHCNLNVYPTTKAACSQRSAWHWIFSRICGGAILLPGDPPPIFADDVSVLRAITRIGTIARRSSAQTGRIESCCTLLDEYSITRRIVYSASCSGNLEGYAWGCLRQFRDILWAFGTHLEACYMVWRDKRYYDLICKRLTRAYQILKTTCLGP